MDSSGYSGTPLAKKSGIKDGFNVHFMNTLDHYFKLFSDLPDINVIGDPQEKSIDFIHLYCTSTFEFENLALKLKLFLKMNGMLWVSWPKGSSKIETDLSRDPIRDFLLRNGLTDVKVYAMDADRSGLKFMYRIKDRKK